MSSEAFDAPEESDKKAGTPGWVWGLGGAAVAIVLSVFVIIPLVAIVIIAGLTLLGASLNEKFDAVGTTVQQSGGGSSIHLFVPADPRVE